MNSPTTAPIRSSMTTAEFLARASETQINELLDGEFIVSPAPLTRHQQSCGDIFFMLRRVIPNGRVFIAPIAVRFDDRNIVEPDVLWGAAESRCQITETHLEGPPDLVVEVLSPGSKRRDRGFKYDLYERFGVREYRIIDPEGGLLERYCLQDGRFVRQGIYGPGESFVSDVLGAECRVPDAV